jgi:3-oxoacyl-[acyl-carrier protein] reductase
MIKNKVAIVTGASKGIGKAIALDLAKAGTKLVLTARNESLLKKLEAKIHKMGGNAVFIVCDMKSEEDIKSLVQQTISIYKKLDILICNAGIGHFGLCQKTTTKDFDEIMTINARAPFILFRECIPYLKKQKKSFIIAIGSVVSVKGYANQSAYTASKHALMGMCKSLAKEVQEDGTRVHIICPGGVNTELVSRARPDLDTSVLMQPEEISDAVNFLLTRKGKAVIDELHLHRESNSPFS